MPKEDLFAVRLRELESSWDRKMEEGYSYEELAFWAENNVDTLFDAIRYYRGRINA